MSPIKGYGGGALHSSRGSASLRTLAMICRPWQGSQGRVESSVAPGRAHNEVSNPLSPLAGLTRTYRILFPPRRVLCNPPPRQFQTSPVRIADIPVAPVCISAVECRRNSPVQTGLLLCSVLLVALLFMQQIIIVISILDKSTHRRILGGSDLQLDL